MSGLFNKYRYQLLPQRKHPLSMKRFVTLFTFFFLLVAANAQSNVKLYAYRQPVSGGAKPSSSIEKNSESKNIDVRAHNNFWLYLSFPQSLSITPTEVFLFGKKYSVTYQQLQQKEVVYTNPNIATEAKKTVLVPKTSNKILMIGLKETSAFTPSAMLKKLMTANEIVVGYTSRGKKNYVVQKKLILMETAYRQ